jgi:hypothetical protein
METKENKPIEKEHMLSGFFDKCRDMYNEGDGKEKTSESEDISGEIAKLKLKEILKILRA